MRESWTRADWGLIVAALGLSLIGAALVWSATHHTLGGTYAVRHLVFTAVGLAMAWWVMRIDSRTIRAWAPWVYLASLLGLLAVLSPLGSTVNGSRSWLQFPGLSLQPAELTKVALAVGLAMILAERGERDQPPPHRDVALAVVVAAVPVLLVLAQPDLGTAVVLSALSLGVIAVAGASRWWLVGALVGGVGAAAVAWLTPLLSAYQRDRILAFADPSVDPGGIGYQVRQVRIAIGSGGWSGQGWGAGQQTQGGFIPYQHTDFVFSVAGEELGLLGAAGVLLISGFIVVRAIFIARRAQDSFGRLVATGVACWLLFQTVQNVGMNLGLLPVTGLPLPFVSYGGSSMFACWIAIGLLGNVHFVSLRRVY
ncbi:rod shape-determining protein RodA [Demetria terragena]|uniref:rod shape-determining protein RodA n=1 Tax=Demetria terragena TaxID=63959 RepID=UPI0003619A99|nr:rod shape-determining protein RodA [Demetria terragena]